MSTARVAVVVPMHNSEAHLEEAVGSILAQTYRGWHAVLVDDASRDSTPQLAAGLAARDPGRFTILTLDENVGVAAARNIGVGSGPEAELIALLDHDDYWLDDYLETAIEIYDRAVAAGRQVGVVASDAWIHDESGLTGRRYSDRFGGLAEIDYDSMIERNMICARALFARQAYDEAGGFASECPGYDDYDLWLRIMEAGYSVEVWPEPIAVYREHSSAMSRNDELMANGAIATYTRALGRGGFDRRRRRRLRSRVRHYRAIRERALVRRGVREGDYGLAARHALRALPAGALAFFQDPGRWREWLGLRAARARSTSS